MEDAKGDTPGVVDVVVVGAGPCGLAVDAAAKRAGLSSLVFDRGSVVNDLTGYPTYMTFFSTAARLSIAGVPFMIATDKPSRREALPYYRGVAQVCNLDLRLYETVESLRPVRVDPRVGQMEPVPPARWLLRSITRTGVSHSTAANSVVIATGYFGRPLAL